MQNITKSFKIRVKSIRNPFKPFPKCMTNHFRNDCKITNISSKMHEKSSNIHAKLIPDAKSEAPGWKSELGERGVEKWVEI